MAHNKLDSTRQKTLLKHYRDKLIQKRADLLKRIGEMAHDDFVALLEIFDKKLEKIKEKFNQTEHH
jgi:cytoplasmic iron level regulating protein YaaA (DUF328/UPF0246 family)